MNISIVTRFALLETGLVRVYLLYNQDALHASAVRHYAHMHSIEEDRDPRVKAVAKLVSQVGLSCTSRVYYIASCCHPPVTLTDSASSPNS